MSWFSGILSASGASSQTITNGALVTYATLRNGAEAVSAYQTAQVLTTESQNVIAIQNMGLSLSTSVAAYFNARVAAVAAAASGITALIPYPQPFAASGLLAKGSPAIASPGFLPWCMAFNAETAPADLLANNLPYCAQEEAAAWLSIANTIQVVQGVPYLDYRYDAAARMYRNSLLIYNTINSFKSGPYAALTSGNEQYAWNSAVALPTILMDAASLMSAPYTLGQQQASVVRYDLDAIILQLSQLLLSLRKPSTASPGLATLGVGQSLQDMAAAQTGAFENWTAIAALNNISPPYPGAANTTLALTGAKLILPSTSGVAVSGQVPNYFANTLGTDWNFGPINENQPPWIGDISLITGYQNFARALGRRLQTSIGTLIYHTTYGSRIPPEVGAIQAPNEAAKLAQYGESAIEQDPRTGRVISAQATTQPGFLATFAATVQPIGPGTTPVNLNETIGPL